ncbi:MAG: hypothetical protein ACI8P0_000573 [Planctomycetaceae bacterium]|jgi:hypothetical protein
MLIPDSYRFVSELLWGDFGIIRDYRNRSSTVSTVRRAFPVRWLVRYLLASICESLH